MTVTQNIPPITLRGRVFTQEDLLLIEQCVFEYYAKGRTYISKRICEKLDWRQPNGWLKDRACRDVLLRLESMNIITLPPPLVSNNNTPKKKVSIELENKIIREFDLTSKVRDFPQKIDLVFAKGNKHEKIWNLLVDKYHYLGHKIIVGRHIKYLIKSETKLLGAIGFSSASWHIKARDNILSNIGVENPREYAINNARFLILPNIEVKNLASHILSIATKKIVSDWSWYYSITPLVVETFVQPSLYSGTCYKAANWIEIGITQGFAKKGMSYHNSQEPKKIFIYGLNKSIRQKLRKIIKEKKGWEPTTH